MSENVVKTDKFLLAATLAATGRPTREIAGAVDVDQRTVQRWFQRPAFRDLVSRLRSELLSAAIGRIFGSADTAADALSELVGSESEKIKLAAAEKILALMFRGYDEFEVLRRLERIEARMGEQQKERGETNDSGATGRS